MGSAQVGIEIAGQLEVGLLEDVRGIEAGPQSGVHAELDHAPQPVAIAIEQFGQRLFVAGAAAQADRRFRFLSDPCSPPLT